MNTHELAKLLLNENDCSITASLDISTCDDDSGDRIFSDDFIGVQSEPNGTITLLFVGSYDNKNL